MEESRMTADVISWEERGNVLRIEESDWQEPQGGISEMFLGAGRRRGHSCGHKRGIHCVQPSGLVLQHQFYKDSLSDRHAFYFSSGKQSCQKRLAELVRTRGGIWQRLLLYLETEILFWAPVSNDSLLKSAWLQTTWGSQERCTQSYTWSFQSTSSGGKKRRKCWAALRQNSLVPVNEIPSSNAP